MLLTVRNDTICPYVRQKAILFVFVLVTLEIWSRVDRREKAKYLLGSCGIGLKSRWWSFHCVGSLLLLKYQYCLNLVGRGMTILTKHIVSVCEQEQ